MGGLPEGEAAPDDGSLPDSALGGVGSAPFAVYIHVPFCAVRCGYCDFNTYAPGETSTRPVEYVEAAGAEIALAGAVLRGAPAVDTVFFGGGTPTLLPSSDLVALLERVRQTWGLSDQVEVTTEANPDSVTPESLQVLREGGFNRISFGMQSASPHVLRVLDRTHDPAGVPRAVQWAREAGFEQVSLDLIYGTPGESLADWRDSLEQALATEPDHISAYSLIVEDGTALARRVRKGEVAQPSEDDYADKYLVADQLLHEAGLSWYEVSNWARPGAECRHNLHYWRSANWWGIGPGAHSHVGGVRWWNRKLPTAYAARLAAGLSPGQGREVLAPEDREVERVLLQLRLREGLEWSASTDELEQRHLLEREGDQIVLTQQGRLLADAVVRELLD
jgi:oxygen-independent coproporphyrinogen-3 oxidase